MRCGVCRADGRPGARFCHRCGFPRTAPDEASPVGRTLPELTEQDVTAELVLGQVVERSADDLLTIRGELLRRFVAEARLRLRLTERFLDADPSTEGGAARLLSLERELAEEWRHGTLTLRRLAAVERRLGIWSEATGLGRRRAALMQKLELDDARLARWLALADRGLAAADVALDALALALNDHAAELEDIRARLATGQVLNVDGGAMATVP